MDTVFTVLMLSAAFFVAFASHEGGHWLAAWAAGFRFGFIAVGPLWLYRAPAGLAIKWRWSPALWAPMVFAWPRTADRYGARVAWYIAGGPLTSLLVAMGAYAASELTGGRLHLAARALAIASACVFAATAQPFVATGVGAASDGRRLADYVFNRERALDEAAAMTAFGLRREGIDPDGEVATRAARVSWADLPKEWQPPF